jgi:hypothetical protein
MSSSRSRPRTSGRTKTGNSRVEAQAAPSRPREGVGNTGNAVHYTGPGTLSALNFSKIEFWSKGTGSGPWVRVDWEQGVYAGNTAKCGSGGQDHRRNGFTSSNPRSRARVGCGALSFRTGRAAAAGSAVSAGDGARWTAPGSEIVGLLATAAGELLVALVSPTGPTVPTHPSRARTLPLRGLGPARAEYGCCIGVLFTRHLPS